MSDSPAPPATLTSPSGSVTFNGFRSTQINVDANGNNIVGDAANEPSICVDPTNRQRMAVGWRQFDSISSNFREAGWGYSSNGGASWRFPGVLRDGEFRSDPVLESDSNGVFYFLSLTRAGDQYCDLWRSHDGGATWIQVGRAAGGDKEWFVIDKTGGVGNGNMYEHWTYPSGFFRPRNFTRSTDAGATWLDPIKTPERPYCGTLDVNELGHLFHAGIGETLGHFVVTRSLNAQFAGQIPIFDLTAQVSLGGYLPGTTHVNPEGIPGQVWVAIDRSSRPTAGNVYVLCTVAGGMNRTDVLIARSTNGGITYGDLRRVNDNPPNQGSYHWFGTISVAPNGRIDVIWNDTRMSPTHARSALFYSYSLDGGLTWAPNLQVGPDFDHRLGYPHQNSKMGDYIDMESDEAGADAAYTATYNGGQDVYHVRLIPLALANDLVVERGAQLSGNVPALRFDDEVRLVLGPGPMIGIQDQPIRFRYEMISQIATPTKLTVRIESHVTAQPTAKVVQKLELFNFATGGYETLDTRESTASDGLTEVEIASNAAQYVQAGTRLVRARVSWRPVDGSGGGTWEARVDQANFIITP
ncbi:exo-alpha-sialidase [Fimbriimonadia bacterium ATM]|nr:exo-alpha-sialidase [Fimbriimonadia bacterium ATM]